ncbi:MAG: ArsR/SmtB family transcription factor [Nocardioides sp.]
MGSELFRAGRPFFEGGETALGLGLLRLVPTLASNSSPREFIALLRETSPEDCALLMLDTGETDQETLDSYRSALRNVDQPGARAEWIGEGLSDALTDRSLEVLTDPRSAKDTIIRFLEGYLSTVFATADDAIGEAVDRAAMASRELLRMQPAVSAVEALTGGYALSEAQQMKRIVLAPSVFIYPFMASRVDESAGEALIVFGVRDDSILGYHESEPEDVLHGAKALANAHRLQILVLLRRGPMLGSELIKRLELAQPTVHHHLAQLRSSGLIRQERTHEGMLYQFRPDGAASLVARLGNFLGVE